LTWHLQASTANEPTESGNSFQEGRVCKSIYIKLKTIYYWNLNIVEFNKTGIGTINFMEVNHQIANFALEQASIVMERSTDSQHTLWYMDINWRLLSSKDMFETVFISTYAPIFECFKFNSLYIFNSLI
jgi:hypothetical protein